MTPTDRSSSDSVPPSRDASQRLAAVRLPIEEPVEDVEDAVRKLQQCDSTDLRRARQHHRRALESLQAGGYNNLSEATREHLVERLRTNLKALNHVLDTTTSASESAKTDAASNERPDSFSSRFRAFVQTFW